jgi:hypothetical protein
MNHRASGRIHLDVRWLVAGLIFLLIAMFATRSGLWSLLSRGLGVGDENAQVSAPAVAAPSVGGPADDWWKLSWQDLGNDATAPSTAGPDDAQPYQEGLDTLATLNVAPKGTMTSYDREADFGEAWMDVDDNGCDTRNDILARDLVDITYKDREHCVVASGTLDDPYTGKTIHFERGVKTSSAVQIDHVVALGNAWVSGADALTQDQRQRLANDPENLLAVDGPTNNEKRDSDASQWLPPNTSYQCAYVARQVHIKDKYDLSVAPDEKRAMEHVLTGCAG